MDTIGIPPNQTIYINNLNEKIKKEELKKSLYHVFSQFGAILEVQAEKTMRKRGQAWVVFESLHGATKAVREMQNFNFYGKPMRVQFAKSRSDVVTKADGTYKPRQKRPLPPLPSKMNKAQKLDATTPMSVSSAAPITVPVAARAVEEAQPNQLLFLENLPEACTEEMLSMLFQQYDGFKEARTVKGRPGIAFVEFTDSYKSKLAKDALHDFQMTDNNKMKITFAK